MSSPPPADESSLPDLPESADLTPIQRTSGVSDVELSGSIDAALGVEGGEEDDAEREDLEIDDGEVVGFSPGIPLVGTPGECVESARQIEIVEPDSITGRQERDGVLLHSVPRVVAASGFDAVTPQTFARIGLEQSETRVVAIRNASRRAASQILAAHRSGLVPNLIDPLADLAWTTYRLVDPRYRVLPFQQVRVGRILPLALHQAAILDLTGPASDEYDARIGARALVEDSPTLPTHPEAPRSLELTPILFGCRLPVVSYPTTFDSTAADLNLAGTAKAAGREEVCNRSQLTLASSKSLSRSNSESMQAYAELRQSKSPKFFQYAIRDTRVMVGLIVVASAAATLLVAFAIRRSITPTTVIAQTTKHETPVVDSRPSEALEPSIIDNAKLGNAGADGSGQGNPSNTIEPVASSVSDPTVLSPAPAPAISLDPKPDSITEPIAPNSEITPAPAPNVMPEPSAKPGIAKEATPDPTSLAESDNIPSMDIDLTGPPTDAVAMKPGSSVDLVDEETDKGDLIEKRTDVSMESSPPALVPEPTATPIRWDSDEAQAVATEVWDRTPSAARRFTSASAAELIDQWDFDAELAGYGTVENVAARSLALRAAWLVESFAQLVDRIREQGPIRDLDEDGSTGESSKITHDPTYHLKSDELQLLLRSWKDARGRVVITDDLDQLLHQANVLVDRILVSDQISPQERSDLIADMTMSTERLSRIARDKTVIAESSQLTEALESFPDPSELERLESSDDPSGFLGRIRCLKQRQWDSGLQWLARTNDRAIASCAKAEWELASADTASPEQWIELAQRWTKVAVRLPDREAAAVYLHAIELYGDSNDYASLREELAANLPRYMAP